MVNAENIDGQNGHEGQLEGKTLEFKREIQKPLRFLQSVSAFANTAGGVIWIGIDDKTHALVGVSDPLKEEERLASIISDSIAPLLVPNIEIVSSGSKSLLRVEVYPGPAKPYHIKTEGPDLGSYVRVGSTNRKADQELVLEMRRSQRGLSYDELPCPDASVTDLDAALFASHLESKPQDLVTAMQNLKLVVSVKGHFFPSNGGMLLFAKDRERFFPDSLIKMAIFNGLDRAKMREIVEFRQPPIEAIDRLLTYVHNQLRVEFDFSESKRKPRLRVPAEALREAVVNSVVHTDYSKSGESIRVSLFSDRIEIENPGLLALGLTIEDIKTGISKARNRAIARYFERAKLIENWGSGIRRMISACQESGLKEPMFEEIGTRFRVTFYFEKCQKTPLTVAEQRILALLSKKPLGTKDIALKLELSERTARTVLSKLVKNGLITHSGKSNLDPTKKFMRVK